MVAFKKPLIIGMVHFAPLVGRPRAPSFEATLEKSTSDLQALLEGGISAVMFENMYDQPHTERLDVRRADQFLQLVSNLTRKLRIPFGISALWNDYCTAFSIAKKTGASWIRVPVLVDSVKTNYGIFRARPKEVIRARKKSEAQSVAIFADVHVKHATLLNKNKTIEASARESIRAGADALIITGTWTGDPPAITDLKRVRDAVGTFPVLIGSGMTSRNVSNYLPMVQGMIVGTALKAGRTSPMRAHNMRTPWQRAVSPAKVRQFLHAVKKAV